MKRFVADLSSKSILEMRKQIIEYRNSLSNKCTELVSKLTDKGISVAMSNSDGEYGDYLIFYKQLNPIKDGVKGVFIATETGLIQKSWQSYDITMTVDVSPLLMAEFGSGWKAKNPKNISGVGQGTFPQQPANNYLGSQHAFDVGGWSWLDLNGDWHHSSGTEPTQPVLKAFEEMYSQITEVAKGVFGNV